MKQETKWLWSFWRNYLLRAFLMIFLTLCKVILVLSYPLFFKWIIDGIGSGLSREKLFWQVICLLAAGAGSATIYIFLQWNRGRMNFLMEKLIRDRVFREVLKKDFQFFRKFPIGDVVTRLLDDISDEKLTWFACSGIFRFFEAACVLILMVTILIKIHASLTVVSVIPLVLIAVLFLLVEKRLHVSYKSVQDSISKINTFLETTFSGIRVIKAYSTENWQKRNFTASLTERSRAEVSQTRLESALHNSYQMMNQLGIIMVLWIGGGNVIRGSMSIGDFVAFSTYIIMLVEPILSIGMFFTRGKQALVSIGRLKEIEEGADIQAEISPTLKEKFKEFSSLQFENVHFRYGENSPEIFSGISFDLRKGEILAFAGPVGAGKSTLALLTLGFVEPTAGRILLNGKPFNQFEIDSYRRKTGWVPQEAYLFSESVSENVSFFRLEMDPGGVMKMLELAEIKSEVEQMEGGLFHPVGQKGQTLSGGQKQRLALARAMYKNPKLLILDDVTAAVDAKTEEKLWNNLVSNRENRTIMVMSHRLATIQKADRVLVLKDGKIIEEGKPSDLTFRKSHLSQLMQTEWSGIDLV